MRGAGGAELASGMLFCGWEVEGKVPEVVLYVIEIGDLAFLLEPTAFVI